MNSATNSIPKLPTYILIDRRGEYPVTEAEWLAHGGAAVRSSQLQLGTA